MKRIIILFILSITSDENEDLCEFSSVLRYTFGGEYEIGGKVYTAADDGSPIWLDTGCGQVIRVIRG